MLVLTTKGLVDHEKLTISDHVEMGDNYRKIATEYHMDGELVRRDVVVNALRGVATESLQGKIG